MRLRYICCVLSLLLGAMSAAPASGEELAERAAISRNVIGLLQGERFADLEAVAQSYRADKSRTSSGLWKLSLFYGGLEQYYWQGESAPGFWRETEERIGKWVAAYPDSATSRLAYGSMLLSYARSLCGCRDPSALSADDRRAYDKALEAARSYLQDNKAIAAADPYWYERMIALARWQNWDGEDFLALIDEALAREPQYLQTYFAAIEYYDQDWHGGAAALERFARKAVKRTNATDGLGLYARIYWYAAQKLYGDGLFDYTEVVWADMKQGIDDVLAKYPDAWNLNNFARFACLAADYPKALELMNRIPGRPMPDVWSGWSYQRCKWWAELITTG